MTPTKMMCLLLALLLAVCGARAMVVQLEVLVLTAPGFSGIGFMTQVMRGYGVPFTVVPVSPSASLNLTELLWTPDSSARFAGYVMYPNLEATGYLTQAQVEELWDFQRKTGARSVKFGAWPRSVGLEPDNSNCGTSDVIMTFTDSTPIGASGVNPAAHLASGGLWRCPGKAAPLLTTCAMWASDFADAGLHTPCTPKPILQFAPQQPDAAPQVAGVLVKYQDGRESLAFVFDCSDHSTTCMLLGHLSLGWMLQGLVPGERRALLTVQLDDFLLTTYFDSSAPAGPSQNVTSYRSSLQDVLSHVTWQQHLKLRLPSGSDIRLDLPFNGGGVIGAKAGAAAQPVGNSLAVDDRSCIDMPAYKDLNCSCWNVGTHACLADAPEFCRNCTKDWPKPLGFGKNRVPQAAVNFSSLWHDQQFRLEDPIATALKNNEGGIADAFFFSHHTFTHENLDNATAFDAAEQLSLNADAAAFLGLSNRSGFSSGCMVTPQISGLHNGDALAALARQGVGCAVGDNTWSFLINPDNPHHMLYTTKKEHGHDGFEILPRFATEIYYNCSTASQNLALYNSLYRSFYGRDSTIDELMQREAVRVVRDGLLSLRHDPYMMHQANLALLDGSGKSLAMHWVEAVVAEFGKYASWPLTSLKLDDLRAAFLARQARDECALSYAIEVGAGGAVTAVMVKSGAAAVNSTQCLAPLIAGGSSATIPVARGGSARVELPGLSWYVPASTA